MANNELSLSSLGIQLPYNMQAEQSVLGAALMDETILNRLITEMDPDMFYSEQNRAVYEEMRRLFSESEAVDVITLVDSLAQNGVFKGEKGDKGERGDRGLVGERGADGKSLNMRGAWQQTAVYYQNDVVVAPAGEGKLGLYCLKVANANGNLPANEPDKWTCFLVTLDVDAYSADQEALWLRYGNTLDDGKGHGSIPDLNKVTV